MNQLRLALNVFEPDSILLRQVYQEYQESSEQVQWFINQKRSDLMEEFSEHKRQYQRNLDDNEEQMHIAKEKSMIVTTDLLDHSTRGYDDSFLQYEKMLQKWNVGFIGQAGIVRQTQNRQLLQQKLKSLSEEIRPDIALALSDMDSNMQGKWSQAVKDKVARTTKKLECLEIKADGMESRSDLF